MSLPETETFPHVRKPDGAGARAVSAPLVVGFCVLVAMLEGFDLQAIGVAALKMGPALHISRAEMSSVFGLSMLGLVLGASLGGRLADRFGRRPMLVASVATFGLLSTLTYFAPDRTWLLVARFLTGIGLGGAMPNLIALAAEVSRPGRRTATATLMFCGMPLGGAIVAASAGWLFQSYGWRSLFLVGGLAPLLLTPLLAILLPDTRTAGREDERLDSVGATLFAEGRAARTVLLWSSYLLTLVILYLLLNWLPLLARYKGLTDRQASDAALAFNIASIFGSLALGVAVDRFGVGWSLGLAYGAMTLSIVLLSGAHGAGPVVGLAALVGFLVVGAQFALYGVTPAYYPPRGRGTAAGAAVAVGRLGSIAGPVLAGVLLARGLTVDSVLAGLAPAAFVAGAAVVTLHVLQTRRSAA